MVRRTPLFLLLLCMPLFIYAQVLEPIGQTFAVSEPDLLQIIAQRLEQMDKAGLIKAQQQQFKAQAKKSVQRPKPYSLPVTTKPRTFDFDPSLTATEDISDNRDRIIVKAGTRVNPLDFVALSKPLLFLNGDDDDQICWLHQKLKNDPNVKIVLIQGDIFKMNDQFDHAIYFDQGGSLSAKLQLTQVPAQVTQKDKHLQIMEDMPCLS